MFCQHCGNRLSNPNAIICTKCGCGTAKAGAMPGSSPSGLKEGWNVGLTPQRWAAAYNMERLISHGANVNAKDNDGKTALHFAAASKNPSVEVLKYLISHGADVNAKDNDGKTPLDVANTEEKQEILREAGGKSGSDLGSE